MYLDPIDSVDRLFFLQEYDCLLIQAIRERVREGDLCIDVGAQKGYVTLHLSREVGNAGLVLAFEPDPRARKLLDSNLARNKVKNTTTFPFALGASDEKAYFHLSSQLGWSTRYPNVLAKPTICENMEVHIKPVDSIFENEHYKKRLSRLSFVKIDCEGSEPEVLQGMTGILREASPAIWIEINVGSLQAAGKGVETITTFFRDLDYIGYIPEAGFFEGKLYVNLLSFNAYQDMKTEVFNLLFLKKAIMENKTPCNCSTG